MRYILYVCSSFMLMYSAVYASDASGSKAHRKNALMQHTIANEAPMQDTIVIDSITAQTLMDWRRDSTGCLKLRNDKMALFLMDKLKMEGKTQDELIEVLGNPNRTWRRKGRRADDKRDKNYIYLMYYCDVYCKDGKPTASRLNLCWLQILIDPTTHRAVSVTYGCS